MTDVVLAVSDGLRARNKLDKLRRIKEAAQTLFVAKGFDETTMREIAVRAGVGLGTIFLYAKDKRDLLFLTINEPLESITREAEDAVDPEALLIDNLLAIAKRHYHFFGQQPALSRLALREMIFYRIWRAGSVVSKNERAIDPAFRPYRRIGDCKRGSRTQRTATVRRLDIILHLSGRAASLARERCCKSSRWFE